MTPQTIIGIDPGVRTGVAVWYRPEKRLLSVQTLSIVGALDFVSAQEGPIELWFEDARLRTWFGGRDANQRKYGAGVREGSGSIKRDCSIWQEFCEARQIPYRAIKPAKGATKWSTEQFTRLTGWTGRTSEHARDAACLVFGR